jgi:hypothetical protein
MNLTSTPTTLELSKETQVKAQIELRVDGDGIAVIIYDPAAFDNWDPTNEGILELKEKLDPSSDMMNCLMMMVTILSLLPPVTKIVDARRGKEHDVSKKNFREIVEGRSDRTWSDKHIKEVYEDRLERGIIDKGDYESFDEFKEMFLKQNK